MRTAFLLLGLSLFLSRSSQAQDKLPSLNVTQLNELLPLIENVEVLFFNYSVTLNMGDENAKKAMFYFEVGDIDIDYTKQNALCELLFTSKGDLIFEAKVYYGEAQNFLLSKYKGQKYLNPMSQYGEQFFQNILNQLKQKGAGN